MENINTKINKKSVTKKSELAHEAVCFFWFIGVHLRKWISERRIQKVYI